MRVEDWERYERGCPNGGLPARDAAERHRARKENGQVFVETGAAVNEPGCGRPGREAEIMARSTHSRGSDDDNDEAPAVEDIIDDNVHDLAGPDLENAAKPRNAELRNAEPRKGESETASNGGATNGVAKSTDVVGEKPERTWV